MTTRLHPCPSCARHIRVTEKACPFCDSALVEWTPQAKVVRLPARLTRAAILFASATATTTAATSCGGKEEPSAFQDGPPPITEAGAALYGAAPFDAGFDARSADAAIRDADAADTDGDAGPGTVILYGPAPVDGG